MSKFIQNVKKLAKALYERKPNDLILVGLFRNNDMLVGRWDLVFSANWVMSNEEESYIFEDLELTADIVKNDKVFDKEDIVQINKFVPLSANSEFVHMCLARFEVEIEDNPIYETPFAVNVRTGAEATEAIIVFCKNINEVADQDNIYLRQIATARIKSKKSSEVIKADKLPVV